MIRYADDLEPFMTPVGEVSQFPGNPRAGDVDEIIASIQRNGMYRPLIVQRSTGHILAGNHSYQACLGLNATHVPVVKVDVDDDTARRIVLADNRTADIGGYDDGQLLKLLQEASVADEMGLYGTGYEVNDLDRLRELVEDGGGFKPSEDGAGVDNSMTTCPQCGATFGGGGK